jgi:YidC/Oxa1 family membrane protein insertase
MDTKRLILSMAIMFALVFAWKAAVDYAVKRWPSLAQKTDQPTTEPATTAPSTQAAGAALASTTQPATAVAGTGLAAAPASGTLATEIGSAQHADPTYAMALAIDPNGAGLSSVTLNDFYETAEHKDLYTFQKPLVGFEAQSRPLATRTVTVNGKSIDLSNIPWQRGPYDSNSATYVAKISDNGQAVLEIDKTFQVLPRNPGGNDDGSKGFEIRVSQEFKNPSPNPVTVKATFNGPTAPERENDRTEDRQFIGGFDDDKVVTAQHSFIGELTRDKPTKDIAGLSKLPLLWVGAGSSYFNAIIRPDNAPGATGWPVKLTAAPATGLNLDAPADQHEASLALETGDFTISPGSSMPFNVRVFLGPKQRALLNNDYYSRFPLSYGETLVYSGGMCGFLTFQWLISVLYWILASFHLIFRDWGLAIIGLVCLVRLILHPITKKSQVNMMSMGKMGPEIERLKKKFGDNKDELNKAMMQFYKEQGFTPILGCLPMFLQMPIWIALWGALQSTFDLRQAGFLRFGAVHLTWIKDLSHPDALIAFHNPIPLFLFGWTLHSINVLPILMGVVYFLQQKFQPQPAVQTPEQEQQRKMMQWMTLLFPLMLYSGPSGLNLYILTSSTLGILESKVIRDHIKEREEAEKAGRIIVDAKPTRASKRKERQEPPKQQKSGGVMGWIADLQAKAEEIRREAERRGKDRA